MQKINKLLTPYNFTDKNSVGRIKYIVIHYVGALGGAKANCQYYAGQYIGASAHYFVGFDGEIWQSVEDADIAWHCGTSSYKHGACRNSNSIGIEMCVRKRSTASMGATDKDWYFEDATVESTAELTRYLMDKYGVPASNVIRHYDVTGKICPNPYVYNCTQHVWDEFKKKISGNTAGNAPEENKQLYRVRKSWKDAKSQLGAYSVLENAKAACKDGYTVYDESGKAVYGAELQPATDAAGVIWAFLTGKGLNAYAAAGLMGNLYAESGLNANNLQNSYSKKFNMSDAEYTAAVDNGSYTNFVHDKAGYGLAQWTYYSRKQALFDYAKAAAASIGDLNMQLAFLWQELQGYKSVMKVLKAATSVRAASDSVLTGYEKPADQSEAVQKKRAEYGQKYYDKYAARQQTAETPQAAAPKVPFKVKVDITDLNIRTGAGTNYAKTGEKTGVGVFTITEVKEGKGADAGWGKLKSGAGWVSLDYCTRLA
jgi:N-acetyl-anhydromuramyl-L-alanine amidase AmpD